MDERKALEEYLFVYVYYQGITVFTKLGYFPNVFVAQEHFRSSNRGVREIATREVKNGLETRNGYYPYKKSHFSRLLELGIFATSKAEFQQKVEEYHLV